MYVIVRAEHRLLAEHVESTLKKLGFAYLKNQALNVTEFMVQTPHRFNVTVERGKGVGLRVLIPGREKRESAIWLKHAIEAGASAADLRMCAEVLMRGLEPAVPAKSWKGLWEF